MNLTCFRSQYLFSSEAPLSQASEIITRFSFIRSKIRLYNIPSDQGIPDLRPQNSKPDLRWKIYDAGIWRPAAEKRVRWEGVGEGKGKDSKTCWEGQTQEGNKGWRQPHLCLDIRHIIADRGALSFMTHSSAYRASHYGKSDAIVSARVLQDSGGEQSHAEHLGANREGDFSRWQTPSATAVFTDRFGDLTQIREKRGKT